MPTELMACGGYRIPFRAVRITTNSVGVKIIVVVSCIHANILYAFYFLVKSSTIQPITTPKLHRIATILKPIINIANASAISSHFLLQQGTKLPIGAFGVKHL